MPGIANCYIWNILDEVRKSIGAVGEGIDPACIQASSAMNR